MILVIDNFDSFTNNLVDYLQQAGVECEIQRNNIQLDSLLDKNYQAIVLSPGPGIPEEAGNLLKIIEHFHSKLPMLGICLGHQAIASHFRASIKKAKAPKHGKLSRILCKQDPIFEGLPSEFQVVRYHSLIIENVPEEIEVLAETKEGEIMAFKHQRFPLYGLQYHPEAVLTEYGMEVLKNWLFLNKIVG